MKVTTTMSRKFRLFGSLVSKKDANALSRKEREAVRQTQQPWVEMALNILNSKTMRMPLTIGVTSAGYGEGKTTTSLGLAAALARESDNKVLLLECDIARASLADQLNLEPSPGLSDYITSGGIIHDSVRSTGVSNLEIMVASGGAKEDADWELWNDNILSRMRRFLPNILANLKEEYAYIILDMPRLLSSPYTKEMLSSLDGALVSTKAGVTTSANIKQVMESIGEDKLFGVVLTGAESPLPSWLLRLLTE